MKIFYETDGSGTHYCVISNSMLPDGFLITQPITINIEESAENIESLIIKEDIEIYLNPSDGYITINIQRPNNSNYRTTHNIWRKIYTEEKQYTRSFELDLSKLISVIYLLKISGNIEHRTIPLFIR